MQKTPYLLLVGAVLCLPMVAQSNPVPLIYQPLNPASVSPGHASFDLTIHGTGFVSGAVVKANGVPLNTEYFNEHTVKARVPAKAITRAGTGLITVTNPGTIDSNVLYLPVREPSSTVALVPDRNVSDAGEVAVGDFNGDHRSDIAVAMGNLDDHSYIDTYLSSGNGKFTETSDPQTINLSYFGPNVAGDFNNDGKLDLAVFDTTGSPDTWYDIFLGDGNGKFTQLISNGPMGATADLNRDGNLDFVGVYWDGYLWYLQVNLGKGDGSFQKPVFTTINLTGGQPAIGDFNGDGRLDVAVPAREGIAIFAGRGDGTFHPEVDLTSQFAQSRLAVADLNGDGTLDIVTNGVSVLLGDGHGNFSASGGIAFAGLNVGNVVLGDWNGDGQLDFATASGDESKRAQYLNVGFGAGDGTFPNFLSFTGKAGNTRLYDVGVGDFNSDGRLDFVVSGDKAVTVLLQTPAP